MKDYIRLVRLFHRNQAASSRDPATGRKKLSKQLMMVLSMLPIALIICAFTAMLSVAVPDKYVFSDIAVIIVTMTQAILLFTSVFNLVNTLYSSADNAFLSSLPLRPHTVFAAKLTIVYVNALELAAIFLLPCLLTFAIGYSIAGADMFYGFYPLILLIVLCAPLLPIFIVTLLSIPLMWLASFFKGRNVLKSVLMIAFYIGIMGGYMALMMFMQTGGGEIIQGGMADGINEILSGISTAMYPNRALVYACMGIDAGVNAGIFMAIAAGLAGLTLALASVFYKRIGAKSAEAHAAEGKKKLEFKSRGIVAALVKKDILCIVRNPSLAMTSFAPLLMAPILLVVMYFSLRAEEVKGVVDIVITGVMLIFGCVFFGGSNMLASIAYTREGESFRVSRTLPLRAKDSIMSKLILAVSLPAVLTLVMTVIALALYRMNAMSAVFCAVCVILLTAGGSAFAIFFDMKKGNVHWKTAADLKNNMNSNVYTYFTMFGSMLAGGLLFGLQFAFLPLYSLIGMYGALAIYWMIAVLLSAGVAAAGVWVLLNKGPEVFDKIGEGKPITYGRAHKNFGGMGRGRGGMLG